MTFAIASAFGNTDARRSSDSQRSLTGMPSKPSWSRSTWPAKRLPNRLIMIGFLRSRLIAAIRRSRGETSSSGRLELEVFVGRGVREPLDAVDAGILDARADAPQEGQLVDRHEHRPVVHDLLDLVEHGLALLPVELLRLTQVQVVDLGHRARGVDAALGHEGL